MAGKHSAFSFFALLAIAAILVPQVSWIQGVTPDPTNPANNLTYTASVWETCLEDPNVQVKTCHFFKFNASDFKHIDEDVALRDGAIAGSLLSALFVVIVFLTTACSNKCAAISFSLFQFVFATAVVGCMGRTYWNYGGFSTAAKTDDFLSNPKLLYGFYIACFHFLMSACASIAACCMPGRNSEYQELNYA